MNQMRMRNSDKVVRTIVGPDMERWFEIRVREAWTSGAPTFSLVYKTMYGGEIPLVINKPLVVIKEQLEKFAKENSLLVFYYVKELVERELTGRRFYAPLLNHGSFQWCAECGGLKKGRVVVLGEGSGVYILKTREESSTLTGYSAKLCECEGVQKFVEIVESVRD